MKLSDLDFPYPDTLIATRPVENSRVLLNISGCNSEISISNLLDQFKAGDLLVLNNSKVVKKRVFAKINQKPDSKDLEVLFLDSLGDGVWEVLFPSSRLKSSQTLLFPDGIEAQIIERGRPQKIKLNREIDFDYFAQFGELPLPPYIQKARGSRHQEQSDDQWYQTAWATEAGSAAAPTASLHFKKEHLDYLKNKGVRIEYITLHVGLGTFLPIESENILEHPMHEEWVEIPQQTKNSIRDLKNTAGSLWALGSTVTRALESYAREMLTEQSSGSSIGKSKLYLYPGEEFKLVDVLMTNFHQPKTTLIAMVAAFSDLNNVKQAYQWAIQKEFRLFSYGDLSVWMK